MNALAVDYIGTKNIIQKSKIIISHKRKITKKYSINLNENLTNISIVVCKTINLINHRINYFKSDIHT